MLWPVRSISNGPERSERAQDKLREARRDGLYLIENRPKADPSCRLQQSLQIEIGTSLREG